MPLPTGYEVLHTFPANAGRAVQAVRTPEDASVLVKPSALSRR
ncbi:hypothetical protein [Amycolatopsis taiwanensis]|nr:hypothetical protein [Amycolatopsis taiwanensis]